MIGIADLRGRLAFHGPGDQGGNAMSAVKTNRKDRVESLLRGMLAMALLAGVIWVLSDGGSSPVFEFIWLRG